MFATLKFSDSRTTVIKVRVKSVSHEVNKNPGQACVMKNVSCRYHDGMRMDKKVWVLRVEISWVWLILNCSDYRPCVANSQQT